MRKTLQKETKFVTSEGHEGSKSNNGSSMGLNQYKFDNMNEIKRKRGSSGRGI
jgi:hypothetical protein